MNFKIVYIEDTDIPEGEVRLDLQANSTPPEKAVMFLVKSTLILLGKVKVGDTLTIKKE